VALIAFAGGATAAEKVLNGLQQRAKIGAQRIKWSAAWRLAGSD
jgi:hypothetical protein